MSALKTALAWLGVGVIALVTAIALVACASRAGSAPSAPSRAAPAAGADADLGRAPDPHAEITRLEDETNELAQQLGIEGLDAPPTQGDGGAGAQPETHASEAGGAEPACSGRSAPACSDTCRLGDAICDNSEAICRLAGELDDAWASDRCERSLATCTRARARCCGCS